MALLNNLSIKLNPTASAERAVATVDVPDPSARRVLQPEGPPRTDQLRRRVRPRRRRRLRSLLRHPRRRQDILPRLVQEALADHGEAGTEESGIDAFMT